MPDKPMKCYITKTAENRFVWALYKSTTMMAVSADEFCSRRNAERSFRRVGIPGVEIITV